MKVIFSSKYCKSYATMAAAERAVSKLELVSGDNIRWIPSMDSEGTGRIVPVLIACFDAAPTGFAVIA